MDERTDERANERTHESEWTNALEAAEDNRLEMAEAAQLARRPKQLATYGLIGSAGLTVVAAALLGASGAKGAKAKQADSDYNSSLLSGDNEAAITAYNDLNQYRSGAAGLRGAGVVSLILAGGGGAFAHLHPLSTQYGVDLTRHLLNPTFWLGPIIAVAMTVFLVIVRPSCMFLHHPWLY